MKSEIINEKLYYNDLVIFKKGGREASGSAIKSLLVMMKVGHH